MTESNGSTDAGNANAGGDAGNTNDAGKTFTQADLDRIVTDRLNRERGKHADELAQYADYPDIKGQLETLIATGQSEQEKAIAAARKEADEKARAEERARVLPGLVEAKFQALAGGKVTPEILREYLDDFQSSKFVNAKGELDVEAITAKVEKLATKQEAFPDLGGGRRGDATKQQSMSALIRNAAGYTT